PPGCTVSAFIGPAVPRLLRETPGRARTASGPGAGGAPVGPGRGWRAAVRDEFLRDREPYRLGRSPGRPYLPAGLPAGRHAARRRRAAAGPPDQGGRPP